MSAIAGIYHMNHEAVRLSDGFRMMHALEKYPADRSDAWHDQGVFLGNHAQWITPESLHERQPCYDPVRKLAITADAIIDNRDELFDQLGVPLHDRSMPDSRLILIAYERWGSRTPEYLHGDFAFVIWDGRDRSLFGARDFSGNRTLYYYHAHHLFAFCTVIHPLFTLPGAAKQPNDQWIAEFLAIEITTDAVDLHSTVYQNIRQVPPSHSITVRNGSISVSRYCHIENGSKIRYGSNEEYVEAFREVFTDAVRARLRTYRQVGAHLSGGLDTGSVVSFAARELQRERKPLHTFSYYPLEEFDNFMAARGRFADERPYIDETVNYVGNIIPNASNFRHMNSYTVIDDWLDMLEMPYKFFENSYWHIGICEQASMQDVGVLLSGQWGNWSISWGPALDFQIKLLRHLRWIRFIHEFNRFAYNMGLSRKRMLRTLAKRTFPQFSHRLSAMQVEPEPQLIHPDLAERMNIADTLRCHGMDKWGRTIDAYEARRILYDKLFFYNINGTAGTRLSLKYKLWDRDPTNDLRLIRFCLALPDEQFVQDGVDRSLIRRATEHMLPDKVRLNGRTRGVQGADGVQRMLPYWDQFVNESRRMLAEPYAAHYLNVEYLASSLDKLQDHPSPEFVFQRDFRMLMRGLIFARFMKAYF